MPWSFIIPAAVGLFSSRQQSKAAQSAADTSASAANRAADLQNQQFQQNREDQLPFLEGGRNALARQQQLLGLGADQGTGDFGRFSRDFGMSDFQADPGFAFRLAEGQKALERNSAARGGLISGSALRAATRFGQDMGSQEYQNAFNRFQTNRANQLNPLQSIAGQGQSVANALGAAGQTNANNIGNLNMMSAANQGNAGMLGANSRTSAYTGIGNQLGRFLENRSSGNSGGYNASNERYLTGNFGSGD